MRLVYFFLSIGVLFSGPAYAGKVETIQDTIQNSCNVKLSYEAALGLLRPLYLTCVPGTKVTVLDKCQVKCLKANSGAVIGR